MLIALVCVTLPLLRDGNGRGFPEGEFSAVKQRPSAYPTSKLLDSHVAAYHSYTVLDFYIPGKTTTGKVVTALITREVHVVDTLKAMVLIGVDVIGPE